METIIACTHKLLKTIYEVLYLIKIHNFTVFFLMLTILQE